MTAAAAPRGSRATAVRAATGALPRLADHEFEYLRTFVRDRSAIVLDDSKQYLVQTRLVPVLRDAGLPSFSALVSSLRTHPRGPLATVVIEAMTTNETSFFRDSHPFDAVTDHLVPELVSAKPGATIDIWCAACSSGQEPYSLAIALSEKHPALVRSRRVRIHATDIAPTMVERTRAGRFSPLEVNRGLPARHLVRYFEQDGRDWVVRAELRSMISTGVLNLTSGAWTGVPRCDLVWLRNVLIYFAPETKSAVLAKVRREVLRPGGHLFLGSSETTLHVDDNFVRREVGRSICYQIPKGSR
jgi:chemotaxis protein methyltransferase CheR